MEDSNGKIQQYRLLLMDNYLSHLTWQFIKYALAYKIVLVALLPYLLATRLIKARVRQEGRASLYDWIVYKRGSKARERKGEERKHRSKLYTILWSHNGNLPVPFSTSTITLPPL